ncbi:DNA-directed RNA polymerase III subunit RPC8 isoform X1 [Selaginella moellendorffii]|uniref:DNA-directed RNA polymerase III subunit RPC8 isoform X1 n=1 Tax=Selaginella moellendorffii TaxID=88036 RepID=UPI000D1C4BDA|nr:DNA-directed RNA polymerase III subunit RPC8 isoform X1 [Selaginella moellendorffii]|eukprot:XP_024516576.1 DNA-directed RNA polymerase III subunit RPC8 isoform X1 [Selaginella moellendorffii]
MVLRMFVLSKLRDTLRIPPANLVLPLLDAITLEIHRLFLDKVVKDLGLCVSLYDIQSIEGGFVFPGDGAPTYTVEFQLVMFRPFPGEILVAKLKKCDKNGLVLSMGFFEDIIVPHHQLQQPSKFDENEKLWVWNYQENEMFMDLEEEVRFRVLKVRYPPIPLEQERDAQPFAPMEVIIIPGRYKLRRTRARLMVVIASDEKNNKRYTHRRSKLSTRDRKA